MKRTQSQQNQDSTDDLPKEISEEIVDVEDSFERKLEKLREELTEARNEARTNLDGWQRAKADYANARKLEDEERTRTLERQKQKILHDILVVADSFDMAMGNKSAWENVDAQWRTGIEYIYSQLLKVLSDYGISPAGEVGEVFDPSKHESVSSESTNNKEEDHRIARVLQKGYASGSNVLRPARVAVFQYVATE